MQRAFADHLRHVGRIYPKEKNKRVVLTIDNAPWHRGPLIDEAMQQNSHLEFYRMPSYSPQLNVIERFWKKLRRRATHNRLFDTIADLKGIRSEQPPVLPDRPGQVTHAHQRPPQESPQMTQHHRERVLRRTSTSYDLAGRTSLVIDPRSLRISMVYDAAGQRGAEQLADGTRITFAYDLAGRRTLLDDVTGRTSTTYDVKGRTIVVTQPTGKTVSYVYDNADRRVYVADPDGGRTTYQHDAAGRLVRVNAPGTGA